MEIKDWQKELMSLWPASGILTAQEVVDHARTHPQSALYEKFDWDDAHAANEHRLHQARHLIVSVKVIMGDNKCVPVAVSLPRDRDVPGGGYRKTEQVMRHSEMREELLSCLAEDARRFMEKWEMFESLSTDLFTALRSVVKRYGGGKC